MSPGYCVVRPMPPTRQADNPCGRKSAANPERQFRSGGACARQVTSSPRPLVRSAGGELRRQGAAMTMEDAVSFALANIDPKLLTGPIASIDR